MSAAAQAQPSAAPPPPTTAAAPAPPAAAAANPPAGQTAAPAADQRPDKCQFWMERKRRHCKFDAVPKKRYCGNHLFLAEGTGPKRVPCPWDPKGGHTVRFWNVWRDERGCVWSCVLGGADAGHLQ